MRPAIEAVAGHHPEVQFLVVDASADPASVAALGVSGIPTVIGYSRGQEVLRSTGRRTRAELESMFEAVAADDVPIPVLGKGDLMLRVGAGGSLITLGLVSGPVWPLGATQPAQASPLARKGENAGTGDSQQRRPRVGPSWKVVTDWPVRDRQVNRPNSGR